MHGGGGRCQNALERKKKPGDLTLKVDFLNRSFIDLFILT
jgi:hypothetical protein